jgi:hypothetical protein
VGCKAPLSLLKEIKMINQNILAKDISEAEGKKVQVNIAQIKEVMKCMLFELSHYTDKEILALVNKYRKG